MEEKIKIQIFDGKLQYLEEKDTYLRWQKYAQAAIKVK